MAKWDFNKVANHGCSPVNLLHIFRTPLTRNTSGRLLLYGYNETRWAVGNVPVTLKTTFQSNYILQKVFAFLSRKKIY